jgi:tripartite-type tricarboxylate transporter receptor subunit TctC
MYDSTVSIGPLVKSGKVRPLAVTGTARSKLFPNVPTVAESGYALFSATNWFGLFAPAGTPKDIVARIHAASVKALSSSDLAERFATQGAEVIASKPDETLEMLKADIAKWAEVARLSGARID